MAFRNQMPELSCLDPDNYRKFFRALCWSGTRKYDKKPLKKVSKKERLRRLKEANILAICDAPSLLGNPSYFAVYSTVRKSILARWRHLQGSLPDLSDDSDNEDGSSCLPISKLPKITSIGLRTVFTLISEARGSNAQFCELALKALLDVLQGHAPEELSQEPNEIITNLHTMLVGIASGTGSDDKPVAPTTITALSSSCLIALSVARGEAELILNAVGLLIMSPPELSEQNIVVPLNLTKLQRSVQSVILGAPVRNQWQQFGVPHQCLVTSFPVDLPPSLISGAGDLVVRSLVCDGCFLYIFTSKGLVKIGSGYGSSIKQHVYLYKSTFFASERHGWMGYCKNKLYLRVGRKNTEIYEINKDSLEMVNTIRLDPGPITPVDSKSAVFTDGNQLGLILLTNYENITIRMYSVDETADRVENESNITIISRKEMKVHLLRRRTLAIGRASFEEIGPRRFVDFDSPIVTQLDNDDDDPLTSIYAGQEFALLTTASGKVYYTGKGNSLGYKTATANTLRWTLMKDNVLTKNDAPNVKKGKIVQIAIGHEGVHAIMVLDNGTALFTGVARRGEDGDSNKHRRNPKPTRPKKMFKADGHHIIYAACNYGSTALVTRQGLLLMFGKDTQHCDSSGVVLGLQHERVIQVALGKAHAAVLTSSGHVYTFGINNKGQCGREFGYTKEKLNTSRLTNSNKEDTHLCQTSHTWSMDYCRVCVLCRECTGFSSACHCSQLPNRVPREKCGCGEGDSGCTVCGICRVCAEAFAVAGSYEQTVIDLEEYDQSVMSDAKNDKETEQFQGKDADFEAQPSTSETQGDVSSKVSCLSPARVALPEGHRVVSIACGLHHTVLLTEHGEVLTFGSNQYGQLGTGDVSSHHRIVRVRVPIASSIAAGSNHTAVLSRDGQLFTFGNNQKGSLGRPRKDEPAHGDRCPVWYATPGRVPRLGPRYACKAVWVSASGDQTFVQVSQALIKTDTLFSSTITANNKCIIILPNCPEHTFKCLTINKSDGSCSTWVGPEQVDFINTLACLDPLYDVLWCYQPQMRVMKCYNILAFDSHKLQRCCNNDSNEFPSDSENDYPNYGNMKRLEDFKNMEHFEVMCNNQEKPTHSVALLNMSVLNQHLAIPYAFGCVVTRMHAALHLLGCLDSLTYAHDNKIYQVECKHDNTVSTVVPVKDDFLTVNRFESQGGGWGYSGHSVEAIRFMCDTDILLGGYGLFGGRGDYTAKIKLFDIGLEGGEQESDGEIIAESDEIVFECAPRDRFPVLFKNPIPLLASKWYIAWACVNGPSSDCGSSGQAMVINDDAGFHFKTSKKSNNGTDVNAGQIPCLLYNLVDPDHVVPNKVVDYGEPIVVLSKTLSRKVTVTCFKLIITLLRWSWTTFKTSLMDTCGQVPINYHKLTIMKHQKRLVYVIRACLRLIKSYVNEIYPQNAKKRNSQEYMSYFEAIADVRNLIQTMMSDPTPHCSMLPKKVPKSWSIRDCYVTFALDMTTSILKEAHETTTACFHAFFPTPTLKWNHLCSLLYYVSEGIVPANQIRELTATCAAMCAARSLRDVLQYVAPLTQTCIVNDNKRPDGKALKDTPSKSHRSRHSNKPPVPPRSNKGGQKSSDSAQTRPIHVDWHLLDVIPKLLDIILIPIKEQIITRNCGQHDHGELRQYEQLSEYSCKFIARVVAELWHNASNIKEDSDTSTVKHIITPSRFMRVNQSRSWNTGNGSPDAVCFTVDRPGIMLVGVCVYGGAGNYEYSLELLHDVKLRSNEDVNPSHCWVSLEVAHGAFNGADCQHDMVQLKFDRAVPLKPDFRYAIRLCNHGGRTANGDCGLPSVKGQDGTTFRFSSCALSFNGTTLARGQIPGLVYYGTSRNTFNPMESTDSLVSALRTMMLRVATLVVDRSADLFCAIRNEVTSEDLKRNCAVLHHSPAINTLIPYVMASLELLDDSKNVIKILELIHKLLPHVAAMNLLMPMNENITSTTGNYYTWVECEHPYKQATVTNMRLLFPSEVAWIVLEMDPRSVTAQTEDSLTLYAVAGTPKQRCHCSSDVRTVEPPFRKRLIQLNENGETEELGDENDSETPCMHYNCTYVSVTPKLSLSNSDWSLKGLLVPGNEVIFSLETATDYLTEFKNSDNDDIRFGFRFLCVGYDDTVLTSQSQGLVTLEMELTYVGSSCATRLLSPNLFIPPLTYNTVPEVQPASGNAVGTSTETDDVQEDAGTTMLLARGLEISCPPTIHQVLDGQPLLRSVSTERQFLADFVAGAESTAGGRLARWLAPTPRVEPAKCELKAPNTMARPSVKLTMPIILRDQYGDIVTSPSLKVEVVVQRVEEVKPKPGCGTSNVARQNFPDVPYEPTIKECMRFQTITMMKEYQNYSFEEIRHASGVCGGTNARSVALFPGGRIPAERLLVRSFMDGSYTASWVPRTTGLFVFRCTFDDLPSSQELTIEVVENTGEGAADRAVQAGGSLESLMPTKLRRFTGQYSAGLRVRASPSLQSEELGRVPPGADVAFVEEVVNKDGTWVRLSEDSARTYAEGCAGVAWCLQHHRHLDRELLEPVEQSSPQSDIAGASGFSDAQDDRRFPFSVRCDLPDDTDCSSGPFMFGSEPSKRARSIRNEQPPLKRVQRRGNGNCDDWPPRKHRSNENFRNIGAILEDDLDIDPDSDSEFRSVSQLAQMGTQTSPDNNDDELVSPMPLYLENSKEDNSDVGSEARQNDQSSSFPRACKSVSPTPSVTTRSTPPTPKKHAISPSQAECVRAVFAATLWHEGIVHDAIACAAFLKFHPQLPKQGARVVTRPPHDVTAPKQQRHSVEVFNAGHYLRIHPSILETLTRSGEEASTSRSRKSNIDLPISEEEGQSSSSRQSSIPSVVNVLPPALRALVALWDALYDSDQLSVATDKFKKETIDKIDNDDSSSRPYSGVRGKRDSKNSSVYKTPHSVKCELCNTSVPPPLAAHMRNAHPGCRAPTLFGYDRTGTYREADTPQPIADSPNALCGQLAQAFQLWYVFCDKCREKTIKESTTMKQLKTITERDSPYERIELPPEVDHHVIKDNAMFLLDLAPITNSESVNITPSQESTSRSPPTPPGSVWLPAPPFQSLDAWRTTPKDNDEVEAARYHSLGRPQMPSIAPLMSAFGIPNPPVGSQWPKVQRSMSMGQAGNRDLAHSAQPLLNWNERAENTDTLSGAGSSLLAQPSAALQRLVGCGNWNAAGCVVSAFETPDFDTENLINGPVMMFVLAKRDLHEYRHKMDTAVRISTVRQYAFEALTWLLRSTTVPTAVHDVMWWFCNAMEKFCRGALSSITLDNTKENGVHNSMIPCVTISPPSTSVICPGGRSGRGARAAFHAFLGSISALASSLPPSSAVGLQAVRCWSLNYSTYDRAFLHRSQVFSVISKILSHPEDNVYEEGMLCAPHESYNSYLIKETHVWMCPDVTSWCDITVSSRQGMAGALTDGSTETFWESGEEDRNKAKWIQITFPGGNPEDRPFIVCVHIDNTRDPMNKTLLVSFLYSGGSSDMVHMQDMEVDTTVASWVCFTLPKVTSSTVRVRCELRGPESAVRVRQIRILSPPALQRSCATAPAQVLHSLSEADTIKVFRLLTSQIFGKLLEWEHSGSDSVAENAAVATVEDVPATDDNDLREHVVGILFAGHKLTSLQCQVMSHIVSAIGSEAARVRDDWETALLCAEAVERNHEELHAKLTSHQQDNYCFEMLSLLLALSGSVVGRAHLAQRTELLSDLLSLLHTGSERVQRQVISLLRRMITELPPKRMLAAIKYGNDVEKRVTLLDHLVCYLGKAITVQMKVKGSSGSFPASLTFGNSVTSAPPATWFMRGETTKKHAHIVVKLLTDMAEDKVSPEWGQETRTALAGYVVAVAHVYEGDRQPSCFIAAPTVWMALAALCVCEQSHVELVTGSGEGREARGRDSSSARPYCVNHDDGSTIAVIECRTCGLLCSECDRFLHLNRSARTHQRQICKEEESTIRVDIHEGCGRAKLFWLLLLVDRRTLKALAEFRGMENICDRSVGENTSRMPGPPGLAGICRFCGTRDNTGLLAIGNVCADQQCQEHSRDACSHVLGCGHVCGGVRDERICLPCLFGCSVGATKNAAPLRQDADDMCMICFTDPLQAAPAIQLTCGHVFHLHCCKKVLTNKWNGPRITFSFSQCPICKEDINHWTLDELLTPVRRLRDEVKRKALMRLEYEGLTTPGGSEAPTSQDPTSYAMDRYAYYVCHKCEKAYFGGLARCEAEINGSWDPAELVCGACSDVDGARICAKHGNDFLEYKCRYCCSVAVFFCFGTSHFCNACHDDYQHITSMPRHLLPQCPAGPKGEQLPGTTDDCPLHVQHMPTGEECALGCGVCRNSHLF